MQDKAIAALPPKSDIGVGRRHVRDGPCVDGTPLARIAEWDVQLSDTSNWFEP
jgi:hypothetical protein